MSHASLSSEQTLQVQTAADRAAKWMWINILIAVGGVVLSVGTYAAAASSESADSYGIFWGAVLFGGWFAIKNAVTLSKAKALLRSPCAPQQMEVSRTTPRRPPVTPVGTLVDVETGGAVGVATTQHLRYAEQSSDNTLRVDAKCQPFAHGSSRWLLEHTRVVRVDESGADSVYAVNASATSAAPGTTFKTLEDTSASLAVGVWEHVRPTDLEVGRLSAVSVDGMRSLVFEGRSGTRFVLEESIIVSAEKVAAGVNYAVDVIYGPTLHEAGAVCIVGPRGRMRTIFATLGQPI